MTPIEVRRYVLVVLILVTLVSIAFRVADVEATARNDMKVLNAQRPAPSECYEDQPCMTVLWWPCWVAHYPCEEND